MTTRPNGESTSCSRLVGKDQRGLDLHGRIAFGRLRRQSAAGPDVLDGSDLPRAAEPLHDLLEERLAFGERLARRSGGGPGAAACPPSLRKSPRHRAWPSPAASGPRVEAPGQKGRRPRASDNEANSGHASSERRSLYRSSMRAVPTRADAVLLRIENARHRRPGAREAERALAAGRGVPPGGPERLIRFHEALLFLRAYPHNERVPGRGRTPPGIRRAARAPAREGRRGSVAVRRPRGRGHRGNDDRDGLLRSTRRACSRRDSRGRSGSTGTPAWPRIGCARPGRSSCRCSKRRRSPTPTWSTSSGSARPPARGSDDPAWLLERYSRLPYPRDDRAERFDSLEVPISWDLGDSEASRTRMRLPGAGLFFHDAPFLARRDVSLDAVLSSRPLALRRLSRRQGEKVCDRMREATAARYREFYTFTYADPATVVAARPGRGVELFLVGVDPDRRLPLRSAYGGFVVKNGVPIGYIEGLALADRLEIGFNMYYTFREGESAWIYAQVLKLHQDALGVTSFSIDPYQLGFENDEALDSGAFWFYRKLGFRPTRAGVRRLLAREEVRIGKDAAYRSSRRTLVRLVAGNLIYDAPGAPRGAWDRFHVRRIGLAVNRRLRASAANAGGVPRAGGSPRREGPRSPPRVVVRARTAAFASLAPVLAEIPDLSRWKSDERRAAVDVVRAKASATRRGASGCCAGTEVRRAVAWARRAAAEPPTLERRSAAPPFRAATISARIAMAISSGERPPRGSPIGPWSRPRTSARESRLHEARPPLLLGALRPSARRRRRGLRQGVSRAGSSSLGSCVRTAIAVELSGAEPARAPSSGHSFTISSAWRKQVALPKASRGSTRIVRNPSVFARVTSATAMCTPPTMTRRGAGAARPRRSLDLPHGIRGSPRSQRGAGLGQRHVIDRTRDGSVLEERELFSEIPLGTPDDRRGTVIRSRLRAAPYGLEQARHREIFPPHVEMQRGHAHAGRRCRSWRSWKLAQYVFGLDDGVSMQPPRPSARMRRAATTSARRSPRFSTATSPSACLAASSTGRCLHEGSDHGLGSPSWGGDGAFAAPAQAAIPLRYSGRGTLPRGRGC